MLGSVLDWMRAKRENGQPRTSMALRAHVRWPLKAYYADLIKRHGFTGASPAADLKDYMGRQVSERARKATKDPYFTQEEASALFAACRAHAPRYVAFIGCQLLAGMRWGEAAGLKREDIHWSKGVMHLRRTWVSRARVLKDLKDHEDRYVPMARQVAELLRPILSRWTWTPSSTAGVTGNGA